MSNKIHNLIIAITIITCTFAFVNPAHAGLIPRPTNNLGLVGYWSMNEATGTSVGDMSGTGNSGTMYNMDPATDWVDGRYGQALEFDGVDDYVEIDEVSSSIASSSLSFIGWVKTGSRGGVVSTNINDGRNGLLFYSDAVWDPDTGTNLFNTETLDNSWHHLAVTLDISDDNLTVYIDGKQDLSYSTTYEANSDDLVSIGQEWDADTTSAHFNGTIDDVRIYDRALSETEIQNQYNRGAARLKQTDRKGLVGHWKLDEGRGQKAGDSSFEGNDGTLKDASTTSADGDTPPQWTDGKLGKALDFDGVDDYVEDSDFPQLKNNLTITGWVKSNTDDVPQGVFAHSVDRSVQIWDSGEIKFYVRSPNDGWSSADIASGDWNTGEWIYVTGVKEGRTIKIYLNGIKKDSYTFSDDPYDPPAQFTIGDHRIVGDRFFNGKIDEVRIYDRALTAKEIKDLYEETQPKVNTSQNQKLTDGLVGMWSFNGKDLTTATATDVSTNTNDGTLGTTTAQEPEDPQPTIGKVGQALNFDGVDDWVGVPHSDNFNFGSNPFTLSVWIKTPTPGDAQSILGHLNYLAGWEWRLQEAYTYTVRFITDNVAIGQWGPTIPADTWLHLAVVGDGNTPVLYLNGELQAPVSPQAFVPIEPYTANLGIGARGDGTLNFNGIIDEVRIYNRALSADEIQRLYRMGH